MEKTFYKTSAWTEISKARLIYATALEHVRIAASNPEFPVDDALRIRREAREAQELLKRAHAALGTLGGEIATNIDAMDLTDSLGGSRRHTVASQQKVNVGASPSAVLHEVHCEQV